MSASPIEILRAYEEAWSDGDAELGCSYYADDLVVHMGGNSRLARDYMGRDDFVHNWVEEVQRQTDCWDCLKFEVLFDGPTGVATMVTEVWGRPGKGRVETNRLGLYKIVDGKIVECWFSDLNPQAVDSLLT